MDIKPPLHHVLVDKHGIIVTTNAKSDGKYKKGDMISYTRTEDVWIKLNGDFFALIHIDNIRDRTNEYKTTKELCNLL